MRKSKFGKVCLAVFVLGWQKMNNNKNLLVFAKILIHYSSIMEAFLGILKHSMD